MIEVVGEEEPLVDGQDVYLSIDARIQAYAYHKLRDAVMQHKARAGSVGSKSFILAVKQVHVSSCGAIHLLPDLLLQ